MKLATFRNMFASLSLFVCTALSAAPLTIDVAGIQSVGQFGDANNTVQLYQVGANARITSLSFTGGLTAFRPSWLSEIYLSFTDQALTRGVFFQPGLGDDVAGSGVYSSSADLVALGLDFTVGADGILRLEFFEDYDDFSGVDGRWDFGTITFGIDTVDGEVPEPASGLLLGAGLAMLGLAQRRRRNAAVH